MDERVEVEAQHTFATDLDAFIHTAMLTDQHTVALIVGNLPAVGRMDLFDVDDVELYVGSEALVNTIEGRNLRPERRSSIAPEDQRDRSLAGMIGEANTPGTRLVIQTAQFEIRRSVTGLRCVWLLSLIHI